MCQTCNDKAPHVLRTNARRKDPTGTQRIRIKFEQEFNKRWAALRRLITQALVDNDVLGLLTINAAPGKGAFQFLTSGNKVGAFMDWLKMQEDEQILGILKGTPIRAAANTSWMNVYINSSYQRGIAQAAMELEGAGMGVTDQWINSAFFRPIHADTVGLIYTRVFEDLTGITNVMDTQISRILAQGIIDGKSPRVLAREINKKVDGIGRVRSRMLARTEVVRAHAEASLNSYAEAGLEGVQVRAEWSTAGDDKVCPECEAMEGKDFTIEESRGMIPLHPNCRCSFIPVVAGPNGEKL